MPMPKPKDPQDEASTGAKLTVGGKEATKLVKQEKVFKADHPDIMSKLMELADAAKQ